MKPPSERRYHGMDLRLDVGELFRLRTSGPPSSVLLALVFVLLHLGWLSAYRSEFLERSL